MHHHQQVSHINTSKPSRPPSKRGTSTTSPSGSGALLGSPRREQILVEQLTPAMAACFLQYCAMCEKQISHPSSSILYCSEACRRKDSSKPLSAANIGTTTSPIITPPSSPKPILIPRTPTGVINTDAPIVSIPQDQHSYKSDLDPTEWKPKLPKVGAAGRQNRYDSEAFRYLAQFHRTIIDEKIGENNDDDNICSDIKIHVSNMSTSLTPMTTTSTAVSTPALSLGSTHASSSSWTISSSNGHGHGHAYSYGFNTRPLPPRYDRWHSSSFVAGKGVDLVTPHIPPPIDAYAKKEVMKGGKIEEGLGAIFGGGSL